MCDAYINHSFAHICTCPHKINAYGHTCKQVPDESPATRSRQLTIARSCPAGCSSPASTGWDSTGRALRTTRAHTSSANASAIPARSRLYRATATTTAAASNANCPRRSAIRLLPARQTKRCKANRTKAPARDPRATPPPDAVIAYVCFSDVKFPRFRLGSLFHFLATLLEHFRPPSCLVLACAHR